MGGSDHCPMVQPRAPNGFTKVDMKMNWYWVSVPVNPVNPDPSIPYILGTAVQHVVGIARTDGMETLRATGVFTSTTELTGTITYTMGNNWDGGALMWAGRLRIVEGTGAFAGIKGPAELNFELMAFELYLHSDPWE